MMTGRRVGELADAYAGPLVLFARQWCDAPEDAVQDAFCKLVQLPIEPDDPAAWLFRAVRNRAVDLGRSGRRRARREAAAARPEGWFRDPGDGTDTAAAVRALDRLPGDQREVIVARLWGGMTLEQVAAAVGCSVSTAHRRYEAGIAALRERLGGECPTT